MENATDGWNPVHTIDGWYDGPREGATDYQGKPYWYRSINREENWNHEEDRFELSELTSEVLTWIKERDAIFQRWDSALKAGAISYQVGDLKSFGALPEDMSRYRELDHKIDTFLAVATPAHLVRGVFEHGARRVRWEKV